MQFYSSTESSKSEGKYSSRRVTVNEAIMQNKLSNYTSHLHHTVKSYNVCGNS